MGEEPAQAGSPAATAAAPMALMTALATGETAAMRMVGMTVTMIHANSERISI
jgi:hypothetical protein